MKFSISTLGCKVNSYESELIKENMILNDYVMVNIDENPDICIINTCTVTNNADNKSLHMLRMLKKMNPKALMIIVGCMIESHKDELDKIDADIILGNKDKSKLVDLIKEHRNRYVKLYDMKNVPFENMVINKYKSKTRAFIKIQDGCNNYCSYCIIPYVRGTIRSKEFKTVIDEVKSLSDTHQEIVLTGIHTGSYNSDGHDMTDLIHELSKMDHVKRIRISSVEITELNDKFMNELKNNQKICNHLHIPLQSGCDKILKLMNRKYDTKYYQEKINLIRSIRPDISITTDLIVGFPNEDDKDFQDTCEFIKLINFTKIHVFPYSIRKGTVAAKMDHQLSESVKHQRSREIIKISDVLEHNYYTKFINKILPVLIETSSDISNGHTDNYINVMINKKLNNNTFYNVKITSVNSKEVYGEVLEIDK